MFSFKNSPTSRPTVHELLSYYKRQKLSLRDDGTRLIRPIPRPSFMINNDDVETNDLLGKVGQKKKTIMRQKTVSTFLSFSFL